MGSHSQCEPRHSRSRGSGVCCTSAGRAGGGMHDGLRVTCRGSGVMMTTKEELLEELTISLPGRLLEQRSEMDYREAVEHWRVQYEAAQAEIRRLRTENSLAWAKVE